MSWENLSRKDKIDFLRKLRAGQLSMDEIFALLPQQTEVWMQGRNGLYRGPGRVAENEPQVELTEEQLQVYKSSYPGPIGGRLFAVHPFQMDQRTTWKHHHFKNKN